MAILKRSACSGYLVRAFFSLTLAVASGCRQAPVPSLAQALQAKGEPAARARAFMRVAVTGRQSEAARAAMLWGVFACDARAPLAGLAGFNIARPAGGLERLAARRLEEALIASHSPAAAWAAAARAPWLVAEDRSRLRLRGAEALALQGDPAGALALAPSFAELRREDVPRALALIARAGGVGGAAARRRLALEFPDRFAEAGPGPALDALAIGFTAAEWGIHAQAWLEAGQPAPALRAAGKAGSAGFVTAARASLRLHRPSAALVWAGRGGERCGACWVERAEAGRQLAWGATARERRRTFGEMLTAAARAAGSLPAGDPLRPRAQLLEAEALVELGRYTEAAAKLAGEGVAVQPRFEWVCRRLAMLDGGAIGAELARSVRGRRLASFWAARRRGRSGDRAGLEALANGGFPDLPAQWAAEALGRAGVAVAVSEERSAPPPPPAWAGDLLAAGRVADVVLGWRADLEGAGSAGPGWLGLVRLAEIPPLEQITLLVRGEPRLLSGPWQGLPRDIMERYLPLPWRSEVEAAARRAGVPPWLVAGLVRQESAWSPRARSAAGALGLAQLLPGVAAEAARETPGLGVAGDLFDPGRNLTLGAVLLARWRRDFSGSWTAALAAYNSGERRTREVWEAAGRSDGPAFVEGLEIPEAWDYVHRVVLFAEGYRILYWPEGKTYPWT